MMIDDSSNKSTMMRAGGGAICFLSVVPPALRNGVRAAAGDAVGRLASWVARRMLCSAPLLSEQTKSAERSHHLHFFTARENACRYSCGGRDYSQP